MMGMLDGCHLLSFFIYSSGLHAWLGQFINPDSANGCVRSYLVPAGKLRFPSAGTLCF